MTSNKYGLAAKYRRQCRNLDEVLQGSRHFNLEAETTVGGQTQCLLAIGEDKKQAFRSYLLL